MNNCLRISKLKRVALLSAALFCFMQAFGQKNLGRNYIPDSSFEKNNLLWNADIANTDTFNKRSQNWKSPTENTPDLLSIKYQKGAKLPMIYYPLKDNYWKLISADTLLLYPHNGNSFAGIVMYSNLIPGFKYKYSREFIQTKLSVKLVPNMKYRVSFYYIKKSGFLIRDSVPPLGLFFSSTPIENRIKTDCYLRTDCTFFKEQYNPQLQFYSLPFSYSKTPAWDNQQVIFKTKDTGLNYLTIGHFSDTTYLDQYFSKSYIQDISYYFDDISIYETPCIVAPDSLCYNSVAPISSTLGMPYYWSSKADGSDTLCADSIYYYKATQSRMIYAFGKYGMDSSYITVLRTILPSWADTLHFCADSLLHLIAGQNNYKYNWNTGNITNAIDVKESGYYKVVIKNGFCIDSVATYALKHPLPVIPLDRNYEVCQEYNELIVLDPGVQYYCHWQPVNSNNCMLFLTFFVELTLTVKDQYGCTSVQDISVKDNCTPRIFIPNAIHLDGVNKAFSPQILFATSIEMKIFNRWGEILYLQNGTKVEWDGKYEEEYCMPGLYYYIIKTTALDGSETINTGCLRLF